MGFKNPIHMPTLAVSMAMLGVDMMMILFGFYYMKVFLNIFKISETWLNITQILFLVWNAVNDPIFGIVQDMGCGGRCQWVMVRRKVILYCSPVFVVSFLLFWFPWAIESPAWVVGLQLMTALFLFDAMFSLVVSAQCGMVAELTTQHAGRVRVIIYNECLGLLASFVIFPVDKLSNNLDDFGTFQISCTVAAFLAGLCYLYTGLMAPREVAQIREMIDSSDDQSAINTEQMLTPSDSMVKEGLKTCLEVFKEKDFWCVVGANFFHILRWMADMNFLVIFTEALVSPNGILPLGSFALSAFYQTVSSLPKLFCMMLWPVLNRVGPWNVLMASLILICINSLAAFFVGRHAYFWVAIFLLLENGLTSSIYFATYFLFFPDVIDLDMKKYKRNRPISTLIFTLNALLTKPAQSLAPIIVVAFLSAADYKTYESFRQQQSHLNSTLSLNGTAALTTIAPMTGVQLDYLFDIMFAVACFFPLATAVGEALLLVPYSMKFRYKRDKNNIKEEAEML